MQLLNISAMFIVWISCSIADAINILGIAPIPLKSHIAGHYGVMKSLYNAGHRVTMIRPAPQALRSIENFKTIDSRTKNTYEFVDQEMPENQNDTTACEMLNFLFDKELRYCADILDSMGMQEILNSRKEKFDVMIVELMTAHECYLPIAKRLAIPVIGVIMTNSWKSLHHASGLSNIPVVLPLGMLASKVEMNWWNDMELNYFCKRPLSRMENIHKEHFTKEELRGRKEISLIFYNNYDSSFSHPSVRAIGIGGIHILPAEPLPEELKKFIEEASHGVILVRSSLFVREKRDAFIAAFASIPQRVIWGFEENIGNLPENILISKRIPQRDILEHENVVAVISHCGQNSVYEAILTSTPVIAIPINRDQSLNAALLRDKKVAFSLNFKNITKETILTALNTVIHDTSYHQNMKLLSQVFRDKRPSQQELVVYWTEYVAKYNFALISESSYQLLMGLLGITILVVNAVFWSTQFLFVFIRQNIFNYGLPFRLVMEQQYTRSLKPLFLCIIYFRVNILMRVTSNSMETNKTAEYSGIESTIYPYVMLDFKAEVVMFVLTGLILLVGSVRHFLRIRQAENANDRIRMILGRTSDYQAYLFFPLINYKLFCFFHLVFQKKMFELPERETESVVYLFRLLITVINIMNVFLTVFIFAWLRFRFLTIFRRTERAFKNIIGQFLYHFLYVNIRIGFVLYKCVRAIRYCLKPEPILALAVLLVHLPDLMYIPDLS